MEDIKQIKADIDRAENHLRSLRESLKASEAKTKEEKQKPMREVAEQAHDALCIHNHTDGCGWGYENDNWNGFAHQRWLDKIEKILDKTETFEPVTTEQLTEIIGLVKEMKKIHPRAMYIIHLLTSRY